jgi:hypothetical protein
MATPAAGNLIEHFSDMDDLRRENRRHLMLDIVVIAICAVVCGANDWSAIEEFGTAKQE